MSSDELDPARADDLWADTYDTDPNPMIALSGEVLAQQAPIPSRAKPHCAQGTGRRFARRRGRV